MSRPQVKALLLDADGVFQTPARGWLSRMAALGGGFEFVREVMEREKETMTGEVDLRPIVEELLAGRGSTATFEEIIDEWCQIVPDPHMLRLADKVRALGVMTVVASNQQPYRGRWMLENLGYEAHFDHQFHSWHLGVAKPDPAYFTAILDRIGVEPQEAVFVDDLAVNVAGARQAGLQAIHFDLLTSYGELRWDLRAAGVPGV